MAYVQYTIVCLEYWGDGGEYSTHCSNFLALGHKDPNRSHFSCLVASLEIWETPFVSQLLGAQS